MTIFVGYLVRGQFQKAAPAADKTSALANLEN